MWVVMSNRWTTEIQNQLDARHMKQYELAERVGISKQHVSDILTGFRECGQDTAQKICHALDIEMDLWCAVRGRIPADLMDRFSPDDLVAMFEQQRRK
jgi:plasmid maintenance system antidote protein VapI